ncbi:MotA/TolQ/ExbB proton channel family protein [Marinobacterium mangrovicola]|uniref:Biopolymer transport protein ExbB n=1 Tax=Marinobacterium mangrovicola TaxID=1476959 RepID=A0A4R1GNS5_9GAMM|nr:MotA/TolQ/ExbB proton channel family protein [Marinobacterium mangrovicola]TCK08910.1 biopolymer transport protein ExbB [Marinobacterium mangrovicola]
MFDLIQAGGWLMVPIIACSILALAIVVERLVALRTTRVIPQGLLAQVWELVRSGEMTPERMRSIKHDSPLGVIVVAGLNSSSHGREVMKESIQEAATLVVHELERFLNSLGTIAAITPLLGLLGTVIGMIKVFTEIMIQGTGNAGVLAGGISEALITTAAGLSVAIPALVLHRYFQRKVDTLVLTMEQESIKLVEIVHGEREVDFK